MIRTARHTAAAIVSAAFVLAASSAAATAASDTTTDKNSDVQYYKGFDDQSPALLGHIQSINSGVDVRSFKISHSKKLVSVHFDVVHLQDKGITASVQLQKNNQSHSGDWLAIFRVQTASDSSGTVHPGEVTILGEAEPSCTVDVTITPGRYGTIHARIPRACLGDPSTLRASAALSRYYKPADDTSEESQFERTWGDSVSATHYRSSDWTPWVKSS
ncbi:MAG: hypothetical protein QOJ72_683 [Nocardioidaceae bacterium]|jgi:hypothetical protein|nr:hypothetical protein [Nocardioidaceae bacterium]